MAEQNSSQPPTLNPAGNFEYSIHRCTRSLRRHADQIFPGVELGENLLIIITIQKSTQDLVQIGPVIENEKNLLLEKFYAWGRQVCDKLRENYWADLIDPCSGYPVYGDSGSTIYSEVEGLQLFLKYRMMQAGNCNVIAHPRWGTFMYPASMFTNAPFEIVQEVINSFPFE
eukprot:TRINITY_DN4291_c0_g1_i1.p1 TRINITY_DN4291_c0_g1~~TRINITY_DN4291_c0_g1_i1.p1  ORF type:complete len:171 (-),score=20.76 TRINITY_DN4291_c0_g1_i1:309-821(-)